MICTKCGKPGARQITDSDGVFLIRCHDCLMDMARAAEQAMADHVERMLELEIAHAETSRQLAEGERKLAESNEEIAEAERKLAEAERKERLSIEESAIGLHGDCCTLIQLAARDLDPADAARVKEAARAARALARKVVTRRAMRTRRQAHAEMLAALGAAVEMAQEALAKRKGGAERGAA